MDKIIARHLTADLYGCKASRLSDEESLPVKVSSLFEEHGFHVMASTLQDIDEDHAALLILFAEGHFAIHLYRDLSYVAADLFLCEYAAAPEDLRLTFDLRTGAIAVQIDCTGAPAAEVPEEELEVVRCILESLVRAVDIRLREDGTASVLLKA